MENKYGSLLDTVTLSNGVKMPRFGLGTVSLEEPIITWALQQGFRNVDTATDYANEEEIGKAVRNCGLERSEVFVTTKVWNRSQGYEKTLQAFELSRKTMGLEYIDLYLIHWPCPDYDLYIDTWKAMEKLYKDGYIRAIGVSNFFPEWIERIRQECEILPMVNQVEYNPFYQQTEIRDYCWANGIQMEAYSPMARGKVGDSFIIQQIAQKYGKNGNQIAARFLYQENICLIPRSTKKERLLSNADIFDFCLTPEEMERIYSLSSPFGRKGMDPYTFHELKNLKDQIAEREAKEKALKQQK